MLFHCDQKFVGPINQDYLILQTLRMTKIAILDRIKNYPPPLFFIIEMGEGEGGGGS